MGLATESEDGLGFGAKIATVQNSSNETLEGVYSSGVYIGVYRVHDLPDQ